MNIDSPSPPLGTLSVIHEDDEQSAIRQSRMFVNEEDVHNETVYYSV